MRFDDEAGLDAGGLSRDFFRLVSTQLLDPSFGLFCVAENGTYALADDAAAAVALEDAATWYGLAGKLVGKALVEGHHLGTSHLNRILLKHLASEPIGLEDLKFVDASLYASFDAGPTRALKRGGARALPRVASTR